MNDPDIYTLPLATRFVRGYTLVLNFVLIPDESLPNHLNFAYYLYQSCTA